MKLRKAEKHEYPRLMELSLLFETSPFGFDKKLRTLAPQYKPVFAEEMLDKRDSVSFVLEEEGNVAGFITVAINSLLSSHIKKNIGSILLLSLDKEYRGRGWGRLLVDNAVRYLFTAGVELITVGTDIYNIPAIHTYESCGFRTSFSWHIFRYYRDFGTHGRGISDAIEPLNLHHLGYYTPYIRKTISLLYDRYVDRDLLREFLQERFQATIQQGKTIALEYYEDDEGAGMIHIMPDEIMKRSLGGNIEVYRILDLIVTERARNPKAKEEILQDMIARFHDFDLIEMWVPTDDTVLCQDLENCGFALSYTGVSLHLHKEKWETQEKNE